ncbi:DUF5820 family protein [Halosimplex sp. J119]
MAFEGLDDDWVVWSDEREKAVLAYRPDVFDSDAFPAPCLPTIYLTKGRRSRHPGDQTRPSDPWVVTLYLEPEVNRSPDQYDTREEARAGAVDIAGRFADGEVDYRDLYQVPREEYFERLDELTGRGE